MEITKSWGKWFSANWERVLFVLVGLTLLGSSLYLIFVENVTEAAVVFSLGFLSFIYANVARFKRFKGLGFEAELWEDKQKEAADLIERLREVVSIYTREVILGKITAGRWSSKVDWGIHWKLYDDLVAQHNVLGQNIDFSDLKKIIDDYFLFDMSMPQISKIQEATSKSKRSAMQKIDKEFGSPVSDSEGYSRRLEQLREIKEGIKDPFQISTKGDLAECVLEAWKDTRARLKRNFDVDADVALNVIERLERISKLYQSRPVQVTDELIAWANHEG